MNSFAFDGISGPLAELLDASAALRAGWCRGCGERDTPCPECAARAARYDAAHAAFCAAVEVAK